MGAYDYGKFKSGLISTPCPNYREKSRGFFKGCDRTCSCTGMGIDAAYASNVCLFYRTSGGTSYIKYDECSNYKKYGIRNRG